jgi:hypothetical protein
MVSRLGRRTIGQVAEWSIAADCKSAAQRATEVQILPCPPSFALGCVRGMPTTARDASGGGPWMTEHECYGWQADHHGASSFGWQSQAPRVRGAKARECDEAGSKRREDEGGAPESDGGAAGRGAQQGEDEGGTCRAEVRGAQQGEDEGGSNSVVESQPSKLLVAGSIPVSRSIRRPRFRRRVPTEARRQRGQRRWAAHEAERFGWQAILRKLRSCGVCPAARVSFGRRPTWRAKAD